MPLRHPNVRFRKLAQIERARSLRQDAGAVTRTAVGCTRAAMSHRGNGVERQSHHIVRGAVRKVGKKADSASVVLAFVDIGRMHGAYYVRP
ncbi:MAG: hypothetical protein NVSMB5_00600 [Candidatus Velthaea sp.]